MRHTEEDRSQSFDPPYSPIRGSIAPESIEIVRGTEKPLAVVPPPFATLRVPGEKIHPSEPSHDIAVFQYGNPNGTPLVVVHGGPALPLRVNQLAFLDFDKTRVVLIHQRGCGESTPLGEVRGNSMEHLVRDMIAVREALRIEQWDVLLHSFGCTVGCNYAAREIDRCKSLVCIAPFLGCAEAIDLLLASEYRRFPEREAARERHFGATYGVPLIDAAAERILSTDPNTRDVAIRQYLNLPEGSDVTKHRAYVSILTHFRHEHYFLPENWIERIGPELAQIEDRRVIHSVDDEILPAQFGYKLHRFLGAGARFISVAGDHFFTVERAQRALRSAVSEL